MYLFVNRQLLDDFLPDEPTQYLHQNVGVGFDELGGDGFGSLLLSPPAIYFHRRRDLCVDVVESVGQLCRLVIPVGDVILDMQGIHFIDSSGFQVLIALLKTAELHQSNIDVMNVSDDLKELFDLLSLSDVFQIAAN